MHHQLQSPSDTNKASHIHQLTQLIIAIAGVPLTVPDSPRPPASPMRPSRSCAALCSLLPFVPESLLLWPPRLLGDGDTVAILLMKKRSRHRPQRTPGGGGGGGGERANDEDIPVLRVAKPKVDEVNAWLGEQKHRDAAQAAITGRVLVLSGPPGSCKKTTVRWLARKAGRHVEEWIAPVPTLYNEHARIEVERDELPYESKLESFLSWFRSISSRNPLALTPAAGITNNSGMGTHDSESQGALVLVDDVPAIQESNARGVSALVDAFVSAHQRSPHPIVLVITTDANNAGPGALTAGAHAAEGKRRRRGMHLYTYTHIHPCPLTSAIVAYVPARACIRNYRAMAHTLTHTSSIRPLTCTYGSLNLISHDLNCRARYVYHIYDSRLQGFRLVCARLWKHCSHTTRRAVSARVRAAGISHSIQS